MNNPIVIDLLGFVGFNSDIPSAQLLVSRSCMVKIFGTKQNDNMSSGNAFSDVLTLVVNVNGSAIQLRVLRS